MGNALFGSGVDAVSSASVILDKLELRDRTQLAVFYLRGGRR